jgi:hypothetical protein
MTRARTTARRAVIVALVIALPAGTGVLRTAGRASAVAVPCLSGSLSTTSVGTITNIVHTSVYANTSYVGSAPFTLKGRHYICTDANGQVQFTLTKSKTTTCNTLPRSKLRVYPPAPPTNVVIEFLISPGKSWCATSKGKEAWYSARVAKVRLYTKDPVFGVAVVERRAVVKDTYGFLAVYAASIKRPVLLGPLQQVAISANGTVREPDAADITPEDRAAIAQLGPAVPTPDYSRPSSGSSKVLARVFSRGVIRVGVDAKAPERTQLFATRFFAALAERWKLRFERVATDARKALAAGEVDLVVTRERARGDTAVLPFATDDVGSPWDLELLPEDDLVSAVRGYLRNALDSADYATHYQAAYAEPVTYQRFRAFIFPKLPRG